jgi:hypothetical protein
MSKSKKNVVPFVFMVFVLYFVCFVPAFDLNAGVGDEHRKNPVAEVAKDQNGINWFPNVDYSSLLLTVSRPDGTVFTKTFEGENAPYLNISTISGGAVVDGSYTYELRVVPVVNVKTSQVPVKGLTQSGYFSIRDGKIVIPVPSVNEEEPDRTFVTTVNDDQVVIGCACIGDDCTGSFSCEDDNTLTLKDTTVRLKFDDTSTTTGYPTNNWRIVINDSGNGGADYFAIEDEDGGTTPFTVEAGAPDNSLYVDDNGYLGLGTATPSYQIHVVKSGDNARIVAERTGAAQMALIGYSAAGFIGTLNDFPMRVLVNNTQRAQYNNDNSVDYTSGATITAGGVFTDASSREYKENIEQLTSKEAIDALKGLNPMKYNYKVDKNEKHVGFIAEDVPELVATKNRKGLSPMDVVAVLTKVVKDQQKAMAEMKKEIEELKKN